MLAAVEVRYQDDGPEMAGALPTAGGLQRAEVVQAPNQVEAEKRAAARFQGDGNQFISLRRVNFLRWLP